MKKYIIIPLIFLYVGCCAQKQAIFKKQLPDINIATKITITTISSALSYGVIRGGENDKYMHWWGSTMVTASLMQLNPYAGLSIGIGLGMLKEIYDSQTGRYFSIQDMRANLIGVSLGLSIYLLQNSFDSNNFRVN